ncbi:MAG TPA: hypothetical protein VF062_10165 [Candidatus Limnocylindrales bacterium]
MCEPAGPILGLGTVEVLGDGLAVVRVGPGVCVREADGDGGGDAWERVGDGDGVGCAEADREAGWDGEVVGWASGGAGFRVPHAAMARRRQGRSAGAGRTGKPPGRWGKDERG